MKNAGRVLILGAFNLILQGQAPPTFTVTDLGVLPGYAISQATAISSNGIVVGYSSTSEFWFYGSPANGSAAGWIAYPQGVGTALPKSQAATIPLGVNASGQVVGISGPVDTAGDYTPFWYQNGDFNTPAGFPANAIPVAISDAGPNVALTFHDPDIVYKAGIWAGQATDLPVPATCSAPHNTCEGQVTGISTDGKQVSGVLSEFTKAGFAGYWPSVWSDGATVQTFFSSPGALSFAMAVNNVGQGGGLINGESAVFNKDGTYSSFSGGLPIGINNMGWIVGAQGTGHGGIVNPPRTSLLVLPVLTWIEQGHAAAFLWINGTQYVFNSCSCVTNSSGWEFDYAYAVNDAGQIVGTGFHNGVQTGFLLTPLSPPTVTAVVNGASFANGGVAPGEIATAFGSNLTSATGINLTSSLPLPTTFLTDSLTVDNKAVPLFAVDSVNGQEQINFQVPWEVAAGANAMIAVSNNGTAGASLSVPVLEAQPGIFNYSVGGKTFGAILHANFALANSANPAQPGETVLIYCTGLGAVESPPEDGAAGNGQHTMAMPSVTIGGTKAIVSFSGLAPGFVGLYQVNAEVPATLKSGNQPVVIEISGASSNSVLLPVQ